MTESFLICSYRYKKVPTLKQVETKVWTLEVNPSLQGLADNIGFEITEVVEDSLFGIETTKCPIDLETMQTTIRGWLSPEGMFCHEVLVERLGKVFFQANHESAQPHYYLDEMGPPLAGILNQSQIQKMKRAYDAPFTIITNSSVVRYKDAEGEGVFCNLTDSRIRFQTIHEFWDFMIASKFYNYNKQEDYDRITVMKGLSTELSSVIKRFASNMRNYFDLRHDSEEQAIKTVMREYIHMDFLRIRHFFRTVMLEPLVNQVKSYKVIEGEFDEGEKAVLRVTVQFLESITHLECISDKDIREWFSDLDKISPKIYATIVYKTLKANNNYQRCLKSNSAKIDKLKSHKDPASLLNERERVFYPWVDDVREMWRLSTFIKSLVAKITSVDVITYRLKSPNTGSAVPYAQSKMIWLGSCSATGVRLAVNQSSKTILLWEESSTVPNSTKILDSVSFHHCQETFLKKSGYFLIVRPKAGNMDEIQTEWLENVDVLQTLANRAITTRSHHMTANVEKIAVSQRFTTILSLVVEDGCPQGRRLEIYDYNQDCTLQLLGEHTDLEASFERWVSLQTDTNSDGEEYESVFGAHFENQKVASRRMYDVKPLDSMIVVIRHRNDLDEINQQQSVTSDFLFLKLKQGNRIDLVASKSLMTRLAASVVTGIGAHSTAQNNYMIFEAKGYGYLLKLSTSELSEQELYMIFRDRVMCLSNSRSIKSLRKVMAKYPQGKAAYNHSHNSLGWYTSQSGLSRVCKSYCFKVVY